MENKIKVLFVVSEFYQAGTQRFTFELDSALNKKHFEVNILSILPLGNNTLFSDHYYSKHLSLGSNIYFWNDVDILNRPTFKQRISRKFFGKNLPNERQLIISFFEKVVSGISKFWNFLKKINNFLFFKFIIPNEFIGRRFQFYLF
jgi:hypothetical protein